MNFRRIELPSHRIFVTPPPGSSSCVARVVVSNSNLQKSQKSLRFDLASAVQVTLISSTPLSLFLFTATLTPASPPGRHFSSSFFASRPIYRRSSHFTMLCHRSSPDFVIQLVHIEVPLKTPEAIEAFNMLSPSYRKKKMEELRMDEAV
ncbi:hypothetical protein Ahy_B10g102524 [Arachis hypogaea]|uniref:Uncharacterized protein n=1 Tax=Arachis hypogaea TaxID=3818 RepID=A0A444X294_ARAHY|nr:hypothetical protein Ahy_B10g102524 [Arachis hypogaea]